MTIDADSFGETLAPNLRMACELDCEFGEDCGLVDTSVSTTKDPDSGDLDTLYSVSCLQRRDCPFLDESKLNKVVAAAGEVTITQLGLSEQLAVRELDG